MGVSGTGKTCWTNTIAKAPDPSRWKLLERAVCPNAFVLKVKYLDCTNFEGIKVLVFKGGLKCFTGKLDPHFSNDSDSPIARFKPTDEGWQLAIELAKNL